MDNIWVLVADQAQATIYACERLGRSLSLIEQVAHPEGSAHVGELLEDDSAPRTQDHVGAGRHAMAEPQDVKRELAERFARQLIAKLEAAHHAGRFDRLAIVAAPQLLGQLRHALGHPLQDRVVCELHKNLVKATPEAVAQSLKEAHATG